MSTITRPAPAPRVVSAYDARRLASVLTDAFLDDPVFGWFFRREAGRRARIERFFHDAALDATMPHGAVQTIGDVDGGALWLPPGEAHSSLGEQLRMLPGMVRIFRRETLRALRGMSAMEAVHPHEPHWYLWLLGIAPSQQGRGLGSALLEPMLDRCDADGTPAYLEATSERNRDLYLRHGFEVTGMLELPASGPPLWLMWRDPR